MSVGLLPPLVKVATSLDPHFFLGEAAPLGPLVLSWALVVAALLTPVN